MIHYTFLRDGEEFAIENYYLGIATHVYVFQEAGFVDVHWYAPQLASTQSGARVEYWADFLGDPPIAFFACRKQDFAHTIAHLS